MNLFHYCSNAALNSIVSNREIWTSQLALSNDLLEGKWTRKIFSDYCAEKGVSVSELDQLLRRLDFIIDMAAYTGFCMSEEGDLLSQWRAYADNGAGVSIGFNPEYFENLGNLKRDRHDTFSAHLTKVEYDVVEQRRLVAEFADEILTLVSNGVLRTPTLLTHMSEEEEGERKKQVGALGLRFISLYFVLFKLKNPAFAEEREWRVITHIFRNGSEKNNDQLKNMDFRPKYDCIVPFARIPLEPLKVPSMSEIVLGPRNMTPEHVLEALLSKHGWEDVLIRRSSASYR